MMPGHKLPYDEIERMILEARNNVLPAILNVVDMQGRIASFHARVELSHDDEPELLAFTNTITFEFWTVDCTFDMDNDPELPTIWIGELEYYKETQ